MVVSVGNFQTVQPERDEEDRHVDEILENLEHLTGLTEHVEFRAITPGRAIGGLFNNMRDLACYSVAADDEWQVYIGVNPRDILESVLKNDIYPGKTPEGVTVSRRKYLLLS